MTIGDAVDNASETSGDLNKEAWDKYNLLRSAVLVEHDTDGTHLSTSGVVLKALFDANTILAANADDTPAALTVAASRIIGRASTGNIAALTAAQVNTILSTATKALDNLASVAINTSLISDTDNTDDLGSAAKEWKDLYIDGTANIDSLVADTADINGGTVDGITSLTAGGNLDIGAYNLQAATLTADGLTATRVIFAGASGLLSDDGDMIFATDTLTVTKLGAFQAAGAINFDSQNMTNVDIDSGTIGGVTLDGTVAGGDQAFSNVGDMTFATGSILKSGSTNTNTLLLAANDTTFITLTTNATDTCAISGAAIDNCIIGAGTAAALTCTTFTSTGIDDNADANAITISSAEVVSLGAAKLTVGATTPTATQWGYVGAMSYGVAIGSVPAFQVTPATEQSDIAEGSAITVVWGTEIYDIDGNFATNTFTAPVTGKYQFNVVLKTGQLDIDASWYQAQLITSNRTYKHAVVPAWAADFDYTFVISVVADMDATDTAYVAIQQSGGANQTDITTESSFSGVLVG